MTGSADLNTADFYDYDLPESSIAQEPLADRAAARLLVLDRASQSIRHMNICDLPKILAPNDLMIVNDSQVVPARLHGRRAETDGRWEGLFLAEVVGDDGRRLVRLLSKTRGTLRVGERIIITGKDGGDQAVLELGARDVGGTWLFDPCSDEPILDLLSRVGRVPLPGYIREGVARSEDVERYQTVFAERPGSAAAPTAGLHFTPALLRELKSRGVKRAEVTLHVGIDTFRPIGTKKIDEHAMHSEWCAVSDKTVAAIRQTQRLGGRVVAVGTTAVRSLETAAQAGAAESFVGATDLYIRPGYSFCAVDVMLTNFHMPRTTLMVLVSAFAGHDLIRHAYQEAVRTGYRFLSYGDAMLIL
jgi:S-adenosylmethionine:tRNA ribosyltransferase-isomerase